MKNLIFVILLVVFVFLTAPVGADEGGGVGPPSPDLGGDSPQQVPEPTTLLLLGVGVAGLLMMQKRIKV